MSICPSVTAPALAGGRFFEAIKLPVLWLCTKTDVYKRQVLYSVFRISIQKRLPQYGILRSIGVGDTGIFRIIFTELAAFLLLEMWIRDRYYTGL